MEENSPQDRTVHPLEIDSSIRIDSIIGQKDAVKLVKDIITILKNRDYFSSWGVDIPNALAFTGPSGCGKTELIRAIANELSCPVVPLYYENIAGSLYGETLKILDKFKKNIEFLVREKGHVIVLLDEADSLFGNRNAQNTHTIDKQIVNFFLSWIDGLFKSTGITFIATSNMWEKVDEALKRPGRFREIKFSALNKEELQELYLLRVSIFEDTYKKIIFPKDKISFPIGFSGSHITLMVKQMISDKAFSCFSESSEILVPYTTQDVEKYSLKYLSDPSKSRRIGFV